MLAFTLSNIHAQSGITEGGVLGTELLLLHWFAISPAFTSLIIDSCAYFLAFKTYGLNYLLDSFLATICYSIAYRFFESIGPLLPNLADKPLTAAVFGGLGVGLSVGLVVKADAACGGDDAIASLLSNFLHISIGYCYALTDITVLLVSLTYIPFSRIFYSLITVSISSFIIDRLQRI